MHAVFDRSSLSAAEDDAIITMHFQKHISLAPDLGPITDPIREDFRDKFLGFWAIWKTRCTNNLALRELRFYDVPASSGDDMGPPEMVTTVGETGTASTDALPPQDAISVTFKTDERKHWGRFYLPGVTAGSIDDVGRVETSECDVLAAEAALMCDRSGTGGHLVVFSRTLWEPKEVSSVQVDDVVDVIRRRRFSTTHYRASATT